jgi:hypothetical protein
MYTVLRFMAGPTCTDDALCDIGRRLNGIRGFVFERLDHAGHRFSISISDDDEWSAHLDALLDFLRKASAVIADARRLGIEMEADAAIDPDDIKGRLYVSCSVPIATLGELQLNGVRLTFTFYAAEAPEN